MIIGLGSKIFYNFLLLTDSPVSAQPRYSVSSSLKVPTKIQPEVKKESAVLKEAQIINKDLPSTKPSEGFIPIDDPKQQPGSIPIIDAQSSSLMEGSGEFDSSEFSGPNNLSERLSTTGKNVVKPPSSNTSPFKPTSLQVSIDDEQHVKAMPEPVINQADLYCAAANADMIPVEKDTVDKWLGEACDAHESTSVTTGGMIVSSTVSAVDSESSEINSSMSSSNTTLLAIKPTEKFSSYGEQTKNMNEESVHSTATLTGSLTCTTTEIIRGDGNENEAFDCISPSSQGSNDRDPVECDSMGTTEKSIAKEMTPKDKAQVISNQMLEAQEVSNNETSNELCGAVRTNSDNDFNEGPTNADVSSNIEHGNGELDSHYSSSIESTSKSYELIKLESMASSFTSISTSADKVAEENAIRVTEICDKKENDQSGCTSGGQNSSGHTSGDDFDMATTATSSDIEVISSPLYGSEHGNGSHGASNIVSPRTGGKFSHYDRKINEHLHKKCHARSSSEISGGSDSAEAFKQLSLAESFSALEARNIKLQKKVSEMSEVLEVREHKLVELSKQNMDLQENNVDLTSQVKEAKKINSRLTETNMASEEFTQRLSSMEQKLQQAIAERDTLKDENTNMKHEAAMRITHVQVDEIISEKNEIITDLRAEGESLSKQVGKQSEIIKKIRQKEKASDKELKNLKEKIERKTEECERLKKSLSAKDEVEKNQIEAVRDLTAANSKWEEDANKRDSALEDATDQASALRLSLETAYKEIAGLKRGISERDDEAKEEELLKEQKVKKELQEELRRCRELGQAEADALLKQIDELRCALSSEERASTRREEHLRRERDEIQQRLELSEARHEELSGSVSTATRPLLRQIESLQAGLSESQCNADRAERGLGERLQQITLQLASCQERERSTAEQYMQTSARLAGLESRLQSAKRTQMDAEARVESLTAEVSRIEDARLKENTLAKALKKSFVEEIGELKKDKEFAETALEAERMALSEEKRRNKDITEQLSEKDKRLKEVSERDLENLRRMSEITNRADSPTPSSASQTGIMNNNANDLDERGGSWMVSKEHKIITIRN